MLLRPLPQPISDEDKDLLLHPPTLEPLKSSHTVDEVEDQLRQIALDLFAAKVGMDAADANVSATPHIGSTDLIRMASQAYGLTIVSSLEMTPIRYVFRAWLSQSGQGRGLHFLTTYLKLLYPQVDKVVQLSQVKSKPYPEKLVVGQRWLHWIGEPGLKIDGSWRVGELMTNYFTDAQRRRKPATYLTSRVEVQIPVGDAHYTSIRDIIDIIRTILPARLVPQVIYVFDPSYVDMPRMEVAGCEIEITRETECHYRRDCTLILTRYGDRRWNLGLNGSTDAPTLSNCRVEATMDRDFRRDCALILTRYGDRRWNLGLNGSTDAPKIRNCRVEATMETTPA